MLESGPAGVDGEAHLRMDQAVPPGPQTWGGGVRIPSILRRQCSVATTSHTIW